MELTELKPLHYHSGNEELTFPLWEEELRENHSYAIVYKQEIANLDAIELIVWVRLIEKP